MRSLLSRFRPDPPAGSTPTSTPVRADAQPITVGAGRVGVVLCHGFTGSPKSLRPWAEQLADAGYRVSVPRLAGHGTRWQDLNRTQWPDWYAGVERALAEVRAECDVVFVGGLSMGGALALRLAALHPDDVAGLVLVNPAVASASPAIRYLLPVLRGIVPSFPAIGNDIAQPGADEGGYPRTPLRAAYSMTRLWADVVGRLRQVRCPVLLYRSVVDHVVDPSSARVILREIGSTDVTEHLLADSFHVATLDHDADRIFAGSIEFFARLQASSDRTR